MHGCGVSTPLAAAVAACTWGLESEVHIPLGGTWTLGTMSSMLAAGASSTPTSDMTTASTPGAVLIEH
jgi:hypothetical protein